MSKIIFWLIVCFDVAVMLFLLVFALAFAISSHTSVLTVFAIFLVIPVVMLVASLVMFVRSRSPFWRGAAFVLVSSPLLVPGLAWATEVVQLRQYTDVRRRTRQAGVLSCRTHA